MRLKSIKLAGFKSFVDPTTVQFPGNLTAIVGPNGCGKSNVIDAVRWVMGESSARQLRGENLTDVIFNGSGTRKPTAQASIELIFDNTDRRITGEYAGYDEIAIRRQVSRDGQSGYFLNGTRCRRKDITDIFLGTGLGPRSYSIIEQGMISGLVEARPEELRAHLEEAAGISKYKERRRETENRMRHTRENLDRLNDLRSELETQLRRLDRQARAAERYRELQTEERALQQALLALRWRALGERLAGLDHRIGERRTALEAGLAEVRRIENHIEDSRAEQVARQEAVNAAHSRAYELGAEVARLEDALSLRRQRLAEIETERQGLAGKRESLAAELTADTRRRESLEAELARIEPELAEARSEVEQVESALEVARQAMAHWQSRWDAGVEALREPERQSQVESTRVSQLQLQLERLDQRASRLGADHGGQISALEGALDADRAAVSAAESVQAQLEERATQAADQVSQARETLEAARERENGARRDFDGLSAQRSGLEAVQAEAMGTSGAARAWLEAAGLADADRLVQHLDVPAEWRRAVEGALGPRLTATCVASLDLAATGELPGDGVFLVEAGMTDTGAEDALAHRLQDRFGLGGLLAQVRTADDLAEALARRGTLAGGECFVTPEGVLVGRNWLQAGRVETDGLIARQATLDQLGRDIETARSALASASEAREQARQRLADAEQQREALAGELRRAAQQTGEARSRLTRREADLSNLQRQEQARREELAAIEQERAGEQAALQQAQARTEAALAAVEQQRQAQARLSEDRAELAAAVTAADTAQREARERVVGLSLRERQVSTQMDSLATALQRLQQQHQDMDERLAALVAEAESTRTPIAEMTGQLEEALVRRREAEEHLTVSRQSFGQVDDRLRQLATDREQAQRRVDEQREALEQIRLERQGEATRQSGLVDQLRDVGATAEAVLETLEPDAEEATTAEALDAVGRRIQRLGPINLAAIEEFEQESERKAYLDSQNQDLTEALETLEAAIRKIDRETRTRFSETFDAVNKGLQTLFPKVFGGGEASLELTDDDLLTTGVSIMARPPGKRNASIHLLSGGEKAMVAVALVLSIFQLNPAPFCMLDEVDAPLDDANVFRFADLLRTMSDDIQFIFITHNKVSMEMSDHLMGVTMQEPGVSRIVSVNVEEAAAMAVG